jgi:hypothetical protein
MTERDSPQASKPSPLRDGLGGRAMAWTTLPGWDWPGPFPSTGYVI